MQPTTARMKMRLTLHRVGQVCTHVVLQLDAARRTIFSGAESGKECLHERASTLSLGTGARDYVTGPTDAQVPK